MLQRGWEAQLHLEHEERRKEEFVIDLFPSRTSILSTYKGVKVDLVTAQESQFQQNNEGYSQGSLAFLWININTNDNM